MSRTPSRDTRHVLNAERKQVDECKQASAPLAAEASAEAAVSDFLGRLLQLHDAALQALARPSFTGAQLLEAERGAASHADNLDDSSADEDAAFFLPLPEDLCHVLHHRDASSAPAFGTQKESPRVPLTRSERLHLARAGEVTEISGVRGSGRKTLVLHSLLRAIFAANNSTESRDDAEPITALWITIPSLSPIEAGSTDEGVARTRTQQVKEEEAQVFQKRDVDARQHIARKALAVWHAVKTENREAGIPSTALSGEGFDGPVDPQYDDPLDRLVIQTCSSVEGITSLLDVVYPVPRENVPKVTLVVIDQVHRLFFDEERLAALPGRTNTSIQAELQRLCHKLVTISRTFGSRIYLINGAMAALPNYPFSSFGSTSNRPSLGNALGHMVDTVLWLSRGAMVFPHVKVNQSTSSSDPASDGTATSAETAKSRTARYEEEVRNTKRGRVISREDDSAEQKLAAAVRAQGPGMRTHVIEVLESARVPKGRWQTYSSDGTAILASPSL